MEQQSERQIPKWLELKLYVVWMVTLITLGVVIGIASDIGKIRFDLKQPCSQEASSGK
jgi:hypothetical protein